MYHLSSPGSEATLALFILSEVGFLCGIFVRRKCCQDAIATSRATSKASLRFRWTENFIER
jgi:hypothetical protein